MSKHARGFRVLYNACVPMAHTLHTPNQPNVGFENPTYGFQTA